MQTDCSNPVILHVAGRLDAYAFLALLSRVLPLRQLLYARLQMLLALLYVLTLTRYDNAHPSLSLGLEIVGVKLYRASNFCSYRC